MDVERAIEHLIQLHAKSEERMAKLERQLGGIQKLIMQGAKMMVRSEQRLARLEEWQKKTDTRIEHLMANLHRIGGNGRRHTNN